MQVYFKSTFIRQFNKLEVALQDEAEEKIALFKSDPKHPQLRVHKLKGRLKGRYSFSVNYATRIVFTNVSKHEVVLLAIGDHDVYKK